MSAKTTARQPKGIPSGGQFAATAHQESPLVLGGKPAQWEDSDAIRALNTTQRRSVAASLEIDGRPDVAATAGVTGHISEFQHRNGQPESPKARQQAALQRALEDAVANTGVEGTVAALREDR